MNGRCLACGGSATPASQRRMVSSHWTCSAKPLRAEGIDDPANLYPDFASGGRDDRPGLESCLGALRKGDALVVWKLGRLGRLRSLGAGSSRSRRPHPNSASDSTRRTRSACREMECFW